MELEAGKPCAFVFFYLDAVCASGLSMFKPQWANTHFTYLGNMNIAQSLGSYHLLPSFSSVYYPGFACPSRSTKLIRTNHCKMWLTIDLTHFFNIAQTWVSFSFLVLRQYFLAHSGYYTIQSFFFDAIPIVCLCLLRLEENFGALSFASFHFCQTHSSLSLQYFFSIWWTYTFLGLNSSFSILKTAENL